MYILKAIGLYIIFALIITFSWQWYEVKAFGSVKPDPFHSLIGIVMALSLTMNVLLWNLLLKK